MKATLQKNQILKQVQNGPVNRDKKNAGRSRNLYRGTGTYKFKALDVFDPKKLHYNSAPIAKNIIQIRAGISNIDTQSMIESYRYIIYQCHIISIFQNC